MPMRRAAHPSTWAGSATCVSWTWTRGGGVRSTRRQGLPHAVLRCAPRLTDLPWCACRVQAPASSPAARAAHACCFFAPGSEQQEQRQQQQQQQQGEHMLLFGGRTAAGRVNDTWVFDLGAKAWAAPSLAGCPPSARSFHSAVALTTRAGAPLAAVFGGLDATSTHVRPRTHAP